MRVDLNLEKALEDM